MVDRSTILIKCPGSRETAVVLAVGPATVFGVGNPKNIGDCPLSIGAEDENSRLLSPTLSLSPGESALHFDPPAGTYRILVAGFTNCTGEAILEYDTPNA